MVSVKAYFCSVIPFIVIDLGISDNGFYKKFHQTDYKIKFERQFVSYFNQSYGTYSYNLFKCNRTHFATNASLTLNMDIENDLEIIVQAYKFLSNEYRIFPIHFLYNFCKGLKNNFGGLKDTIQKCGTLSCPMRKNIQYSVCNFMLDESKLPPFMPNGRFKIVYEGRYKNDLVLILEVCLAVYRPIVPGKRVN